MRIADRFHVNRYITDALQAVRRRVSQTLSPDSVKYLKRYKNLLSQRWDELKEKDQTKLLKVLSFSNELADVYQIKEGLKPFKNWTQEISNYHQCRYTNAAVEG